MLLPYVSAATAWQDTLPRWDAGVRGGIPNFPVKVEITAEDLRAATDSAAFLQEAIATVETPATLHLPPGTYHLQRSLVMRSGVVLRGSGELDTHLVFDLEPFEEPSGVRPALGAIQFAGKRGHATIPLVQEAQRGAQILQIAKSDAFAPGDLVLLASENDPARMFTDPRWDRDWARESLAQILTIVAVDGTRLMLDTPLRLDYPLTRAPRLEHLSPITSAGLENLHLSRIDQLSDNLVGFEVALNCWVRHCETEMTGRGHLWINFSRFVTLSGNHCHHAIDYGGGGNGYGIVAGNVATDCLIENNELHHLRHALMAKRGSSGNVFAYNYSYARQREPAGKPLLCDISLHGHYPHENLFEGNVVEFVELADYWGPTGPFTTFFRNHVRDRFQLNDASHQTIIWGNRLPASGVSSDGTSDALVLADNWSAPTSAPQDLSHVPQQHLPHSLYYETRPSFWTDLPWPLSPHLEAPSVRASGRIPAEARARQRANARP